MPESNRNRIVGAIPSRRYGRPDEVTDPVTFLAPDDAGYITAQEIGIDGGLELNTLSIVGSTKMNLRCLVTGSGGRWHQHVADHGATVAEVG
jgi:hypothetical protein